MNAYVRLMRLDKPIGFLLLWYPTAWALWSASGHKPEINILLLFILGTLIMRSVGCVINDIFDRDLDKFVTRTKTRPITNGELSVKSAWILVGILLSLAALVLLNLSYSTIKFAIAALFITFTYPLCKRFIHAPQLVLGLAFSMGIPMAYAALDQPLNSNTFLLFLINFLWIIAYDTVYAMADKKDDLLIGIKSTAIFFGKYDKTVVGILFIFAHLIWLIFIYNTHIGNTFYLFWVMAAFVLITQLQMIKNNNPENFIKAFKTNNYYGALMWSALIFGF